jgi:hypothetical protein
MTPARFDPFRPGGKVGTKGKATADLQKRIAVVLPFAARICPFDV